MHQEPPIGHAPKCHGQSPARQDATVRKTAHKTPSKWDVHLYRRCGGVLFARQRTKRHWLACVADAAASDFVIVTRAEAEMLLRAWLSPLPAPPIERLSDLE